jgi:hypothetical protein
LKGQIKESNGDIQSAGQVCLDRVKKNNKIKGLQLLQYSKTGYNIQLAIEIMEKCCYITVMNKINKEIKFQSVRTI